MLLRFKEENYVFWVVARVSENSEPSSPLSGSPWSLPQPRDGSHLPWFLFHLPGHSAFSDIQVPLGHLQLLPHLIQPPSQVTLSLPKLLVL